MVIAWHDAAFTLPEPILTPEVMRKVLRKFQLQHQLKQTWSKEEARMYEKLLYLEENKEARAAGEQQPRDEADVKKQEEITRAIEEERLKMKEMRGTSE